MRALETYFAEGGFFSHGLEGEVLSRAGHTAERIATLLGGDQMIGDDEQYASMALAAREMGIPARVVMGYYPDEKQEGEPAFTATGDDVHAWVEVAFEGFGLGDDQPHAARGQGSSGSEHQAASRPEAPQVLQPPPPPQEPVDLPPTVPDDREPEDDTPNILGIIAVILAIVGVSLLVLLILASPFIVIGAWKAAKRRSRRLAERRSDRISGGWTNSPIARSTTAPASAPGGTRTEEAAVVEAALTVPTVTALAERADGQGVRAGRADR